MCCIFFVRAVQAACLVADEVRLVRTRSYCALRRAVGGSLKGIKGFRDLRDNTVLGRCLPTLPGQATLKVHVHAVVFSGPFSKSCCFPVKGSSFSLEVSVACLRGFDARPVRIEHRLQEEVFWGDGDDSWEETKKTRKGAEEDEEDEEDDDDEDEGEDEVGGVGNAVKSGVNGSSDKDQSSVYVRELQLTALLVASRVAATMVQGNIWPGRASELFYTQRTAVEQRSGTPPCYPTPPSSSLEHYKRPVSLPPFSLLSSSS
jgi:hypothetical protein